MKERLQFANRLAAIPLAEIVIGPNRMRQLRPEKVDELAGSFAAQGQLQPIIVRPSGRRRYWLVVGRHRLEAAKKVGQKTITATILDGADADRALLAEIDENLIRADLSPAERALHMERRKELYEKLHPETVSVRVRGGPGRGKKNDAQNERGFVANVAKKISKGRSTVQRDVTRAKHCVVLADIVGTALDQGDEIDALAKLPEAEQRKLAERAKAGEKVQVKVAVKKMQRERREHELAAATKAASQALGTELYGVIYADCPWRYDNPPMGDVARANERHYPTMELADICDFQVPAADDCGLFLWSTVPMLPQALQVMGAWGFTYKSSIVWVKDKAGTGYWVRGQAELLLIGTKGHVPAPAPGEQPPAVVEAPRGRHSEKPPVFAEIIEQLFPNTPKLEMFARTARHGWSVWGNEIPRAEFTPPVMQAAE